MLTRSKILLVLYIAITVTSTLANGSALRIIGGTEATPGEFPFLVAIQLRAGFVQHQCGGTLVNMSRVITAAHCVHLASPTEIAVVAGAHYLRDALAGVKQSRNVRSITIHESYSHSISLNDIAILDLNTPFEENNEVSSIPYASWNQETAGGDCQIAGWGNTDTTGNYSEVLRKGSITVHSKSQCSAVYSAAFDPNTQICAGNLNGEKVDFCFGDTGGPLICKRNGEKYFAGVASWGRGCAQVGMPVVYTEIAKYRYWLSILHGGDSSTTDQPTTTTTTTTRRTPSDESNNQNPDNIPELEEELDQPVEEEEIIVKNPKPFFPCGSSLKK